MTPAARKVWLVGGVAWLIAAGWLWAIRLDGFIPADEGVLGQTAERVLAGELPHLDFDDTYTGGLAMAHAGVFRVFGVRSAALRDLLWVVSLAFVAALWTLLAETCRPAVAALLLLLALSWSLACYFAAMPSWYNLFFAVFGLLALRRFGDGGDRRWLLLAGLAGGFSILCKIAGFFYLGAAALAALYLRQLHHRAADNAPSGRPGWPMAVLLGAVSLATAGGLWLVLGRAISPSHALFFLMPGLALLPVLWVEEYRPKTAPAAERALLSLHDLAALGAGALAPIALFLLPYLGKSGSWTALVDGILVAPAARLAAAAYPLPPLTGFLPALPLLLLVVAAWLIPGRWTAVLVGLLALGWVLLGYQTFCYVATWRFARLILPLLVVVGCGRLITGRGERDGALFTTLAVAALASLVQFPYSRGIYFCYVAPLVVVAFAEWVARERQQPDSWRPRNAPALTALAACFALFALAWLHRAHLPALGVGWEPRGELATLLPERVGLEVPIVHQRAYTALTRFIQQNSAPDRPLLALPDLPQLSFFAARRNPTRCLYDVLARPGKPDAELAFGSAVDLVVINHQPEFSPPLPESRLQSIRERFPQGRVLGPLEIRGRAFADPGSQP